MPKHNWRFEALGTLWEITSSNKIPETLRRTVAARIDAFDALFSRFRPDAEIAALREEGGTITLAEEHLPLLEAYESLGALTQWRMSPLVGEALETAGYGRGYSLAPASVITAVPEYMQAIKRHHTTLTAAQPLVFDVGAAGKGHLVDLLVDLLTQEGLTNFVIDASGDMRVIGATTERVGLENPLDTTRVMGVVELSNKALAASAVNRRVWGEWHHVIDATTSRPATDVIATWVVAETAMLADALATALFFVSAKELQSTYNYEYLRMRADGAIECSEYFKKGMFV